MSRFYGPGTPKMKTGYIPRESCIKAPDAINPDLFILFVLKSGAALELSEKSLDEVVGTWASRLCNTVCGRKADGTKAVIPVDNIDYMEEVK